MHKLMTDETPVKVLSLVGAAVISMFFMAAVANSGVAWGENSGVAISDPFSPANVMAVVDQTANVYSDAVNGYFLTPVNSDFGFMPENLAWIKDNAELTLAVAVGLDDPLPQVTAASGRAIGHVAGANTYNPEYYDNIFSLYTSQ